MSIYLKPRSFAWLLHASGGLIALLLAAAGWYLAEGPLRQRHSELARRIDDDLRLARSAAAVRARHAALLDKVAHLDRQLTAARAKVQFAHPTRLFEQFAELSRQAGAEVHDYRPGQVQSIGALNEHKVQLALNGDYASLCRFLTGLEQLPLLCHVAQIKLTSSGIAGSSLHMELQMRCYGTAATIQPAIGARS